VDRIARAVEIQAMLGDVHQALPQWIAMSPFDVILVGFQVEASSILLSLASAQEFEQLFVHF